STAPTPVTPRQHTTVEDASDKDNLPPPLKCRQEPEGEQDRSGPSNPFAEPLPQTRPSDYLRAACPLCFGGKFSQSPSPSEPDDITVFVPEGDAERMDHYVSAIRPLRKPQQVKHARQEPEDLDHDHYEGGTAGHLRVPKSVLDDCEVGFTAADDCREKASTQFFDDTALMALVCHHDIVLWLVNMCSAGEKQHYTIVLLETLFQHLPPKARARLLYDIGCQLERSCIKWGFLDQFLDRLIFAISVFHAFGHQWTCQIIYHPHKREGFGLTNGEGCERYHQHLYTLDRQVHYARGDIIEKLGQWLAWQTRHASTKHSVAESIFKPPKAQTLSEQSRGRGKDAVQELIELRKGRDLLKERVRDLEDVLISGDSPDTAADAELELPRAHASLKEHNTKIMDKQNTLGISNHQQLDKLFNNPYYTVLMNAHAAKTTLQEKLRFHKFVLDLVQQAHDTMSAMIRDQKAPHGARSPAKIDSKGLWALDIDEIWQDIGLDEDVSELQPPAWPCEEHVRNGIKALLEHDRCLEEETRLIHEHRSLQVWFSEEWKVVNAAIDGTVWQKSIQSLDCGNSDSLPPWGPSTEEILAATVSEVTASVNDGFDDEEFVHNPEDEADLELVDVMDSVALVDSYGNILVDDGNMLYDTLDL
ncbi:hypothetical protein DXG01_001825, partial [Tephrocybe rancida]